MFIFPWLKAFFTDKDNPESPAAHGPIHIEVNPIFNNAPNMSQEALPIQSNEQTVNVEDSEPPRAKKATWNPQAEAAEVEVLAFNLGRWERSPTGSKGMLVWLVNEPAAQGERAKEFRSIFATLKYRENGETLAHVERAYWLDSIGNLVDLKFTQRKAIVLGTFHGCVWNAFNNSLAKLAPRSLQYHQVIPKPVQYPIQFKELLETEVFIVSSATGETIKNFDVEIRNLGEGEMTAIVSQTISEA